MPATINIGALQIPLHGCLPNSEREFLASALESIECATNERGLSAQALLMLALTGTLKSMVATTAGACLRCIFDAHRDEHFVLSALSTGLFTATWRGLEVPPATIARWVPVEVRQGVADAHCVRGWLCDQGLLPTQIVFQGDHWLWFAMETNVPEELADT